MSVVIYIYVYVCTWAYMQAVTNNATVELNYIMTTE
jgi:hypothetical protein